MKDYFTKRLEIKLEECNFDYRTNMRTMVRQDCTTRTISKLLNLPYKEVLKNQFELGLKYEVGRINWDVITDDILMAAGYKKRVLLDQCVGQFMYEHKTGKYAIKAGGHICAYIDGTWYDSAYDLECPDAFLLEKVRAVYYYLP